MNTNADKLKKIISAYTPIFYKNIKLNVELKDRYVAAEFKFNFCNDICDVWPSINSKGLRNDMFTVLKTGNDILSVVKYIKMYDY